MNVKVVIPWRDRGKDLRRGANLEVVQSWWYGLGYDVVIQSDGLEGDAPFNRHRAYNLAVERFPETDVFVFAEADILLPASQVRDAIAEAMGEIGIVVPFTQYRYMSDTATGFIRDYYYDHSPGDIATWWALEATDHRSLFAMNPESTMEDGKSIGAVNVISRLSIEMAGGFTEMTSGNWYDDNITEETFRHFTKKTRHIEGPATHLYHLPGWKGDHLSTEDQQATAWNKQVLLAARLGIRQNDEKAVRYITQFRVGR